MDKLRWGLLSTARINRAVIPPLRSSQRSELSGVASRELIKAQAYAKTWGIARAYGSYEALLADPDIDVIYNPLPNHLHAAWSIKCAEAGKHVLCEKPFALSVAEVDRVLAAARANNVIIAEALMYRHHPQTLKVLELLGQHAIGELIAIKSAFTFTPDRAGDVRWSPDWGGGSIWDVGCYPISFACLIAQAAPVEAFGWQQLGASGVDVAFAGQLRFAGGLTAQIECGFSSPYRAWLEVVGTQGALYADKPFKPAGDVAISLNYEDRVEVIKVRDHALYQGEIEDMECAALDGRPPRIPLADSRTVVAAISALLKSARSGQVVRL
jgi:D-xylose 1-dehydrogenase (NADP+, D-xylono-1,5-lactone-forming)